MKKENDVVPEVSRSGSVLAAMGSKRVCSCFTWDMARNSGALQKTHTVQNSWMRLLDGKVRLIAVDCCNF